MHFKFEEINNYFGLKGFDTFVLKGAKYKDITNIKMVLFLSEIEDEDKYKNIICLTMLKNVVSALQYKYGLKK